VAPSHVRLPGRTLYLARRADVPAKRVVCGLADTAGDTTRMLPADQENANLVLAVADGTPADPLARHGRSRPGQIGRRVRFLLGNNLVRLAVVLIGLIVLGLVLIATVEHVGFWGALYQTLLDAAGNAVPDTTNTLHPTAKIDQVVVTLSGLALIPVATAAVVDGLVRARFADPAPDPARFGDHVVVVGLGNVGTRVVGQLHDLGVSVICVETDENARGVQLARRLGVPVVFGDATRDDTLRAASVANARALVLLTSSDVVNLEAALQGRALRDDLRVVLRLFDDDLAERVERSLGFAISRSVSRLAASAFAAAVVERQVIGTMSIGRSVLMIAEVPVVDGSPLAGRQIGAANEPDQARVIALRHHSRPELDWAPGSTYELAPQDRLIVVATRGGLGRLLARSIAPTAQQDAS
jgi:Trk K+ transport system NAD-binding subunit